MQKDVIIKISSILQCQKIPEGIRIRLENHLFPNWKQQKSHLGQPKTSQKTKNRVSCKSHADVSGKSRSAENLKEGIRWVF